MALWRDGSPTCMWVCQHIKVPCSKWKKQLLLFTNLTVLCCCLFSKKMSGIVKWPRSNKSCQSSCDAPMQPKHQLSITLHTAHHRTYALTEHACKAPCLPAEQCMHLHKSYITHHLRHNLSPISAHLLRFHSAPNPHHTLSIA